MLEKLAAIVNARRAFDTLIERERDGSRLRRHAQSAPPGFMNHTRAMMTDQELSRYS